MTRRYLIEVEDATGAPSGRAEELALAYAAQQWAAAWFATDGRPLPTVRVREVSQDDLRAPVTQPAETPGAASQSKKKRVVFQFDDRSSSPRQERREDPAKPNWEGPR